MSDDQLSASRPSQVSSTDNLGSMNRLPSVCAANLALSVAIGAFGAHAIRGTVSDAMMEVFKTGHTYHLAVGAIALFLALTPRLGLSRCAWALLIGTMLFSGSLYALALTGQRLWGAVTPLGGATWIVTFLAVAVVLWKPTTVQSGVGTDVAGTHT